MRKFFGTDGIRGKANVYPMTADLALKLGMACGKIFRDGNHRHRVVIGKDTRLSGYMLEPALSAGFVAMGIDVITVGPVPTPAVGILTKSMRCDVGVMISASHNPYYDNGIKLFGPDGYKLDDNIERTIEQEMSKDLSDNYVSPDKLGRVRRLEDAKGRYMEIVKSSINPRGFSKLKVVLDCANGAAYAIAPTILWELGCEVISIAVEPNGFNINENCGSTNPEKMCKVVKEHKADLGIALDGDADRITMCDEKGQLIDGDKILAIIATKLAQTDKLKLNGVVATVMSNLGLEQYLNSLKISMIRTKVGDRYVVDNMRKNGFNLGGEQSGHIILTDIATTGDGIVSALQILSILAEKGIPASELFDIYKPYPQELRNYLYKDSNPLELPEVRSITQEIEDQFAKNKNGRILTRKSGTEPLIRVMIEAEEYKLVKEYHEKLSKVMS